MVRDYLLPIGWRTKDYFACKSHTVSFEAARTSSDIDAAVQALEDNRTERPLAGCMVVLTVRSAQFPDHSN